MGRYVYRLFIFLYYFQLVFSRLPSDQVSIMTRVYEMFQNSSGSSFVWSGVGKGSDPCSWIGVSCSPRNTSITKLSLRSFSMSSSEILPLLCRVRTLESLDVSNNSFSFIPDGFFTSCGEISGLRILNFSWNTLSGSLPTFNGFRMLQHLDFAHNSLTGEISSQFDGLDSLKSLNLSHNQFIGTVPEKLGRTNLLEELQLSFNNFTGELPANITNYRNLSLIDLSFNELSGSVPEELGQLTELTILVLSHNNLSGEIPKSLCNLTSLLRFVANENNFIGTIPSGITSYSLRSLDLSYNDLNGIIPSGLLSGPNLEFLDLSNNELAGSIPANISTRLFRLRLGSNSLNGTLPFRGSSRNLVKLTYLELDNNRLIGSIPPELGMCKALALLNLAQNQLTGPLPPALGNLTNLQVLSLQLNNLVGETPLQITMLSRLLTLNISRNALNGSIPSRISSLKILQKLDLQGNDLAGPIPSSIGELSSLIELQLGKNKLNGQIPAMPPALRIALNLSYNLFVGRIPNMLSRSSELEVLDLSNNRFSGSIPDFLSQILTKLDLSNNQLSGLVPRFGYGLLVNTSGNKDLIYRTESPPPPTATVTTTQEKSKSPALGIFIAVSTATTAVSLLIMMALFISIKYKRIKSRRLRSGEEISPPVVIHGNLLTPHIAHRSGINFRRAMKTVADPSNIILKTRFSTYYKVSMPSETSYVIKRLNWGDTKFQWGSHGRFEDELELLGKLSCPNVMIPLAYVLTVDSAYLFYESESKGTLFDALHGGSVGNTLVWADRHSISIGVAYGMASLHGCNSGPVLLLNLSSQTILLNSLCEPQVGEIELCKVMDPSKTTRSLSTFSGSVGYIPPEYAMRVTAAANVYNFGIFLLELLTGKPAEGGGTELVKLVLNNQNEWDHILDPTISTFSLTVRSQMLAVLRVALACLKVSPEERPKMKGVLRMLLNAKCS